MTPRRHVGRRRRLAVLIAAALASWPAPAEAHLVTTGLGPVYDGISHLLLSPDDLLSVAVMGLLAGLNGPTAARGALFALTVGWLVGGLAGLVAGHPFVPAGAAASILVLGTLTAADRRLSPSLVTSIALAVGSMHGWLNGAAIAEAKHEPLGLVGIVSATFVIVALVAAFVVSWRAVWAARIAVRVAGSWAAAIGLLILGWSLRGTF